MDNYGREDDPSTTVDALISPQMDFSTVENPYLLFDHAYARFRGDLSDTLVLFYSTDCAETFIPIWAKGGAELATAQPTEQSFEPTAQQWASNQILLADVMGMDQVHLAFANVSGWGNNLYLDNLQVADLTGSGPPQPIEIRASDTAVCEGEFVQFDDQTAEFPTSWTWTFEGGTPAISTEQSPVVQYNTAGVYGVTLKVSNQSGETTDTLDNVITVGAPPQVAITPDQSSYCPGDTITLTATGTDSVFWYDERSLDPVSDESPYEVQLYENRRYYVLGLTSAGCADTASIWIELEEGANVAIQASDTLVCSGETVTLTATGADSYTWFFQNDTLSTETTFEFTASTSATVGIAGTVTSGCPGFDVQNIAVIENPEAEITIDGLQLTASGGEGYQWFRDSVAIEGATSQSYAANAAGSYQVRVTYLDGCSRLSEPVAFEVTGFEELGISTSLIAYPNPSTGKFSLQISGPNTGRFEYQMTDISGKIIQKATFEKSTETFTVELQLEGRPGVYFMKVSDGENVGVLKILKH